MANKISVCICTYKRPEFLFKTLCGVVSQVTESNFIFEIIIIDNDHLHSAEKVVNYFKKKSTIDIIYDCEPKQNISLARNLAIKKASGDFIAFIDDDEIPEPTWLLNLYKAIKKTNVSGVLGPVLPLFLNPPPKWIVRSKLFDRMRFKTGTIIQNLRYMRTGNVLISNNLIANDSMLFNPEYGRTGGEDADFFKRKMDLGHKFVWCDKAIVHEIIPPDRYKRSYHIKRAFIRGMPTVKIEPFLSLGTLKSILAVCIYTLSLPIIFILGQHIFMQYLIKDCDHLSKLLAHARINLINTRDDIS